MIKNIIIPNATNKVIITDLLISIDINIAITINNIITKEAIITPKVFFVSLFMKYPLPSLE